MTLFNLALLLLAFFLMGTIVGQSFSLGWGLPIGTTLTCMIAALAFIVAAYQSYSTHRHNRILVEPHLIFQSKFNGGTLDGYYTYSLKVKNVGMGPAVIRKYDIRLGNDEPLNGHSVLEVWVKFVNDHLNAKGGARCLAGFLYADHALEKGEEKALLEVHFPRGDLKFMGARKLVKSAVELIDARIDYECYYGRNFSIAKKPNEMTTSPEQSNIQS
ncbi:hypothetical protein [Pseudomonas guariconensis]|uniref:hypothetical protein n=1 Tax=Pseudomonas guariconensis TaxID=1288410 RepID=UPI001E560DF3|nr:hypothetical protein [Pseudomonas guariconensis]